MVYDLGFRSWPVRSLHVKLMSFWRPWWMKRKYVLHFHDTPWFCFNLYGDALLVFVSTHHFCYCSSWIYCSPSCNLTVLIVPCWLGTSARYMFYSWNILLLWHFICISYMVILKSLVWCWFLAISRLLFVWWSGRQHNLSVMFK
jgi:hypothetical protein